MITLREYINETEWAIKSIFDGINQYHAMLKDIKHPGYVFTAEDDIERDKLIKEWSEKNKDEINRYLMKQRELSGYRFGFSTLCGSILQIAYMGIKQFSDNHENVCCYPEPIGKNKITKKFCIGRKVRKVHIGLIIFAGRNQYNHLDEEILNPANKIIFDMIALNHGIKGAEGIKDPAFDLESNTIYNYAHNIIFILGWRSYDNYYKDMVDILVN
jgi:hypothetical protein